MEAIFTFLGIIFFGWVVFGLFPSIQEGKRDEARRRDPDGNDSSNYHF